jgi:FixJ family two-component response regulator
MPTLTQRPAQPNQAKSPLSSPTTHTLPLVHVVDDEPAIQALFQSLGKSAGFEVAAYGSAAEFRARFDGRRTGCLVLDLNLPDCSGIDLLRGLATDSAGMPTVFMSGMATVASAVDALKLGSIDFVEKPFDLPVMQAAVLRAVAADQARRASQANRGELQSRFDLLSPREVEVMELVVAGAANKEIAARLGLSPKTVEVHRANVMRKTRAESLAELVRMRMTLAG